MASQPYQEQVSAGGSTPIPQAGADAFGAGVGGALIQYGESAEKIGEKMRAVNANQENMDASIQLERASQAVDKYENDDRLGLTPDAKPDGEGHTDRVLKQYDQLTEDLAGGISDRRVRESMQARILETRGNIQRRTENTAIALSAAGFARKAGELDHLSSSTIVQSDNEADIDTAVGRYTAAIDAMDAPPEVKAAKIAHAQPMFHDAFLSGQAVRHPETVAPLIATGRFNDVGADGLLEIQHKANVQIIQNANAAKTAQREADTRATKAADAVYGDAERGVDVDPRILQTEAARVEATDPARAGKFRAMASGAAATQLYRKADPGLTTGAIAKIERQSGWERNPDLVAQHTALISLRDRQRSAEPELAPLDFNDPAAVAARHVDAQTWAATHNGQLHILSKDQATQLSVLAQGGAGSRAELAGMLGQLRGRDAINAAEQVAPHDYALRQAIGLPVQLQQQLFKGEELRKADSRLVPSDKVATRWDEHLAPALRDMPEELQNTVQAGINNIYAYRARQAGATEFDQDLYDRVADDVLAKSGLGSLGAWQMNRWLPGGGAALLLPPGMSQSDFNSRLAAAPSNIGAYYADHTPISKSELFARFRPVPIDRPGVYRWVDPQGNYARGKTGGFAELDVTRQVRAPVHPAPAAKPAPVGNAYENLPTPQVDPVYREAGGAYGAAKP